MQAEEKEEEERLLVTHSYPRTMNTTLSAARRSAARDRH